MGDRRELYLNEEETARASLSAIQAKLYTALPCIIQSYNNTDKKMTVDAQPTINGMVLQKNGTYLGIQMPVLLDCPVLWQGGGGVTATFPIAAGDECLVILASRCIDNWWANGWKTGGSSTQANAANNPAILRMHDLSDGFALVGLRSQPRSFAIDTANAALITDDGATYFKLNPTTKAISVQASGGINLNGFQIDSSGNAMTAGTVTATTDVVGGGKHLKTHEHTLTQPGTGVSGPPQ